MTTLVEYLGHATVRLELGGISLLTDPVLRDRVLHIRRLASAPPPSVPEADAILISHAHHDHLDLPSLRLLRPCPVVAPRGSRRMLARAGFEEVTELDVGESTMLGETRITATPATHPGRRHPLAREAPALGYLIAGSSHVYFAGDTDLFDEMDGLADDLELALLPVGGWGPRVGKGHLDPRRAAMAASMLRPRVAVPIHWGTMSVAWARVDDPDGPAREFERLAAELAPEVEVRVLRPGDSSSL